MTTAQAVQRLRRADLVEGIGIHVGPGTVAMAHVRKRFLRLSLEGVAVQALPAASDPVLRRDRLVTAVRGFIAERGIDAARVALVLPRSLMMASRVLLPAAAAENLAQVLEYEIENLLPLPKDEIVYAYATRPSTEERIAVTLLCIPRGVLQEHVDALADAGVRPRVVTMTAFAVADWVTFAREDASPAGVVVSEGDAVDVAVVDGKHFITTQVLPKGMIETPSGFTQNVLRVLDERPVPEMPVYGWHLGAGAELIGAQDDASLVALGRERLEGETDFFDDASAAALPAVGGALGVVREATLEANLLPADQRRGVDDGMSIGTIAMTALVGVLLVVLGVSTVLKDELLRRTVSNRLAALAPQVEQVRELQDDIDTLRERLDILDEGQDRRVVDLVESITELVPTSAYLTSLAFRRGRLTMDGQATSASDVLTALEKSRRFKKVTFSSPTTRAGDKERFALSAEVAR